MEWRKAYSKASNFLAVALIATIFSVIVSCNILGEYNNPENHGNTNYYSVTYDANGATSGTVPVDSNSYAAGATVTVLGNTGGLAKTGYSFAWWNTKADGTGTNYTAGGTFTMGSANVTLYAQWIMQFSAISAGYFHTMILKTDGTLWATGDNEYGQLGDGTTTNRSTPVQVMRDVQAVAAGGCHTMILKTDGTLWATGDNEYRQLGDGTTTNRSTPVQVMRDVQAVAAGVWHNMILKTDGTLWATGYNLNGQLGDGTWTNRSTPVQVMRDVKAAAAGYRHTMILKTDGTLWATGCNSDGEFGDSTATYRSTPVQINF